MFDIIFVLGPAAITYLVRSKCKKSSMENSLISIIRFIAYAFLDMAVIVVLMRLINKITVVYMPNGGVTFQYGIAALVLSIPIAIFMGIVLSMLDLKTETVKEDEE